MTVIFSFLFWCVLYLVCAVPYGKYLVDGAWFGFGESKLTRGVVIVVGFMLLSLIGTEIRELYQLLPFHTYEG